VIRRRYRPGRGSERAGGQSLVEFSLALIPFVFLLMGVIDLGRGIWVNNGIAQAAREIARTAAVHQCIGPCTSATWATETVATINTQKRLVPGLANSGITIDCVDVANAVVTVTSPNSCPPGDYVRVRTTATFRLITPFLPVPNPFTVSSVAHIQIQ